MRPGFKKFLAVLLVVFFVGYLAVTGIADLANTKDVQTVTIDECVSFLDIEHSINGLIPVGTDHYYLGVNDETMEACVVKASKKWYKKNFDTDGHALMEDGLTVTALCKKAGDFDVENELASRAAGLDGLNLVTAPGYSLELDYKFNAICKLILLVAAAVLAGVGYMFYKKPDKVSKTVGKIYGVTILVFLVLLLKVIL